LSHYETELEEMIHLKAGIHSTLEGTESMLPVMAGWE
jgi:hypothetical protein